MTMSIFNTIKQKKSTSTRKGLEGEQFLSPSNAAPPTTVISGPIASAMPTKGEYALVPSPWKNKAVGNFGPSPVHYEQRLQQSEQLPQEPFKDLVLFPTDEIQLNTKPKFHRTSASKQTREQFHHRVDVDPYIQDRLDFFCEDYVYLSYKYGYQKATDLKNVEELPEHEYEFDSWTSSNDILSKMKNFSNWVAKEKSVGHNQFHHEYVKKYVLESDEGNAEARSENRISLFQCFEQLKGASSDESLLNRESPALENDTKLFKMMINLQSLSFTLGDYEPFFVSLALYNIKTKNKLSETFYVDLNSENALKHLEKKENDPVTSTTKCLFTLRNVSQDVYLVVRIEKVFQSELEDGQEPYMTAPDKKNDIEKAKKKITEQVQQFCSRYGHYRQAFAWAAVPIFNKDGYVDLKSDVTISDLYRTGSHQLSDQGLLELIEEMIEHPKNFEKKAKPILGFLRLNVSEVKDDRSFYKPYRLLDPSLHLIECYSSLGTTDPTNIQAATIVRELSEFSETPCYETYTHYENLLYIYPQYLNLNAKGAKNIGVKVQLKKGDTVEDAPGLKVIYGKSKGPKLINHHVTHVTFKNKQPEFYEEIKVLLPPGLTPNHHLYFTFFNVNTKVKKGEEEVEQVLGYAFLPLLSHGNFVANEQSLPIAVVKKGDELSQYLKNEELQYYDNAKDLFTFKLKLLSTIYSQDSALSNFLRMYNVKDITHPDTEKQLIESIIGLREVSADLAIQYLPSVFNGLCTIMSSHPKNPAAMEAMSTMIVICATIHKHECRNKTSQRSAILTHYVKDIFNMVRDPENTSSEEIYHALCNTYLMYLMERKIKGLENVKLEDLQYCWFIYDLIIKAMTLKLIRNQELHKENAQRQTWFSANFVLVLKRLITFHTRFFAEKSTSSFGPGEFKASIESSKNLAWFISDLFSVLDRGEVLDMVRLYLETINIEDMESAAGTKIVFFKFDFLRIIVENIHYVPLNLPFTYSIEDVNGLYQQITGKHPMSSLVLHEIRLIVIHSLASLRQKGIGTFTSLISKHAFDARYQDPEKRQRVAGLYFPLILMLLDNWYDPLMRSWRENADVSEKRSLYVNIIWVLKNADRNLIRQWWRLEENNKLLYFCNLLGECVVAFEYHSPQENEHSKKGAVALEKESDGRNRILIAKKSESSSSNNLTVAPTGQKELTPPKPSSSTSSGSLPIMKGDSPMGPDVLKKKVPVNAAKQRAKEAALNYEASLTILDIVEDMIADFKEDFFTTTPQKPNDLMDRILSLLTLILRCMEPVRLIQHIFATLRSFLFKFREIIFITYPPFCGELCMILLRLCGCSNHTIKEEATSLLYFVIRNNQQLGSFRRVSIQLTTSLAKLVGDEILQCEPEIFERTLSRLYSFAVYDYSMPENPLDVKNNIYVPLEMKLLFVRQVEELTGRLTKIMKDTNQVREIEQQGADPERIADLYSRIAKGYSTTPELRVTWLQSLVRKHEKDKNYMEAGVCCVHIACIVALYLQQKNPQLPLLMETFEKIVPGISEVVEEEEEDLFTETEMITAVAEAVRFFEMDQLYEFGIELNKFLIPIYEYKGSNIDLARIYDDIKNQYEQIIQIDETRMLGKYYRVGFYGYRFEDIHNKEFVYKEPKSTHLFELKDRLTSFYGNLFGVSNIIVFPDSSPVDVNKLDLTKCHLQITSLEPYFTAEDHRKTFFERNTSINRFVYSTPFTKDGRSQGALNEQFLRKTIVTVPSTFPFLVKRLPITERKEIILSPIENAIEAMEKRNAKMLSEINAFPPNIKSLQSLLQGSVLALVNEGPLEICKQFLDASITSQNDEKFLRKLRDTMREFLRVCEEALDLNGRLISGIQQDFQDALSEGYQKLTTQMAPYLPLETNTPSSPKKPRRSRHHKKSTTSSSSSDKVKRSSKDEATKDEKDKKDKKEKKIEVERKKSSSDLIGNPVASSSSKNRKSVTK